MSPSWSFVLSSVVNTNPRASQLLASSPQIRSQQRLDACVGPRPFIIPQDASPHPSRTRQNGGYRPAPQCLLPVLFPLPSPNDPNDPLRWPRWKKHVAFFSVCAFTFLTNYGIGGLAPAFYILSLEFDRTMARTSDLVLWPIPVLGAFNFFWVPLTNYFGKWPVFVLASALLCACFFWGAAARSFESLLRSNIIAAFSGSSTEALGASTVNDLYFLHERGSKMGVYMNFIAGGNTVGPLLCGFIVTDLSWGWHKWIAAILTAINFLTVFLFVPETRYCRDDNETTPGSEPQTVLSSQEDANGSRDLEKTAKAVA
ncbi:hypothetical protein VTK56DRAFT_6963 [Thermocarpiscus australiensis]